MLRLIHLTHITTFVLISFLVSFLAFPTAGHTSEKFTILLDWFINPDHAPLVIAQEKGMFADAGLDVTLIEPADPNAPPRLLAAGEGDIAISYQPQLYLQIDAGLPVMRVATLIATPLNSLVVLDDGPIKDIADLVGKKIGYSIGGFEEILLSTVLKEAGLRLDDVELVNVNFALSPALLSGQVDAVIGAFRNFELNQLHLEGRKGKAFYLEEHGVPPYDELIILARSNDVKSPKIKAFLGALERAVIYLINHPEESWEVFKTSAPGLDNALNEMAFRDTLTRFALRPAALDRGRYTQFGEFVHRSGLVETVPALSDYAVEIENR